MEKDSAVIYRSFYDAVTTLPKACQGQAMMNIMRYIFDGKEPEKKDAIFIMAKPQIDAANERYTNACKGAEFGKLGGRPKNEKPCRVSENVKTDNPIGLSNETLKGYQKKGKSKTLNESDNYNESDIEKENRERETPQPFPQPDNGMPYPIGYDFDGLIKGTGFSPKAVAVVRRWVDYKHQKGEPFVQQSLWSLLNRIGQAMVQYGEVRVLWVIEESLSNGWKNIRWEKLEEQKDTGPAKDYNAMVLDELCEEMV